jgi:tetratricopeptide (TPR) repeat protein
MPEDPPTTPDAENDSVNNADVNRLAAEAAELHENGDPAAETKYEEAIALAVETGASRATLARLRMKLATLLDFSQQEAKAAPVYENAIADFEEMETPDEDTGAQLRNNLAMLYKGLGKFALAEQHYLKALEILETKYGRSSEFTATLFNNLGGLYYTAGFPEQAREIIQDALDVRLELLGPDHPDVAQSYCNLATACHDLGNSETALIHYESALRILEKNIRAEAASYETTGLDYVSLLSSLGEEKRANAFKKRMEKVLAA